MGEAAEDIVEGRVCDLCGSFFDDGSENLYSHGYPATCWECWGELSKAEKRNRQRALVDTV